MLIKNEILNLVPNFILEVIPARTDMVVQLSSMGSSGFPTIGI
jgi:hypothetical protein